MAALRVEVRPDHKGEVTRLAHRGIDATVHTFRTFIAVEMRHDGTFVVVARRDGAEIGRIVSTEAEV